MAKSSKSSSGCSSTDYTNSPPLYKIALSPKQKLQIEIINLDNDLEQLALRAPSIKSLVDKIRDTLGRIVHLADGADVRQLCGPSMED
ncbi:MAG TPA: hypothetical protein VFZ55_06290 [Nitrososphaera sp.]